MGKYGIIIMITFFVCILSGGAKAEDKGGFLYELPGGLQEINVVEIKEQGSNIRRFTIEARVGKEWKSVYTNDLIEAYRLCVLEEAVVTDALRVVVEKEEKESSSVIAELTARYLEPVKREKEFINAAYVSSTYFEHGWDSIHQENFKSLTDIIMIGNFSFNKNGDFVIIKHGEDGSGVTPYLWENPIVKENMQQWKERVMIDPENRLWISITCLKEGENGTPGGNTDTFHDPEVRKKFIGQLVAFAKEYGIEGYDIDWEYPSTGSQWEDYNQLILEASQELHKNGILFSTAQSAGSGLNAEALRALDRIYLMAYDNYSTMNNHSTFYNSAVKIIDEFKKKGIPEEKIVLGMPYYGVKVDSYHEQWDYSHIYNQMLQENGTVDKGVNVYGGWGFNGVSLIRDKVVYALEQRLGGVFIWQMKNDIPDYGSEYSLAGTTGRTLDRFIE